jgi:hypothetical protein
MGFDISLRLLTPVNEGHFMNTVHIEGKATSLPAFQRAPLSLAQMSG